MPFISGSKTVMIHHEEMIIDETIDVTITMIEVVEEVMVTVDTTEVTTIEVMMTDEEETVVAMATMIEEVVTETEVASETEVVTVIDHQDEISMEGQNDESKELNSVLFVGI